MIIKGLTDKTIEGFSQLYKRQVPPEKIQIEKTNPEFKGDVTLVVFPLLKFSGKPPQVTGLEIGQYLQENLDFVASFEIVKGFLNITIADKFWLDFVSENIRDEDYGWSKSHSKIPFLFHCRNPQSLRQAGDKDQPYQRPRYPYLQIDACLDEMGKRGNARIERIKGRPPDR